MISAQTLRVCQRYLELRLDLREKFEKRFKVDFEE
jgi:hypothetical protein